MQSKLKLKVSTYNINYSRRADGDFGAYHLDKRSKYVYDLMNKVGATVWCVQEVHQDYIDEFTRTLSDKQWHFQPQNSRGGKLTSIGIGIERSLPSVDTHYDISDIEWVSFNFNQYHPVGEIVVGCLIKSLQTLIVSVHFPMDLDARKSMVDNFDEFLKLHTYTHLVICGDFNSFPNGWGYQQIPRLNAKCCTYSASEFAVHSSNGSYAKHSFTPYPYDVVPKDALKMIGKLDHILVKNLYAETAVLVHDDLIPNTMISPSDHYPMSIELSGFK